jgi:uncharacterized protein involved in outer membrane biogenesis
MSRRSGCLLVAAITAVLLLVGAFAAYRAVDAQALRLVAERQLTTIMGEPVTIGRMSLSLFPVPAVTGTDVRIASAPADGAPGVSVRAVRILPQWRTLLSRPVVIDAVQIEGLTVMVRRDRERRWILPGPPAPPASGGGAFGGVPGLPGGGASETVAVHRVRLRDGRIAIVDDVLRTPAGSAEVAAITGIDADLEQRPGGGGTLSMHGALGGSVLTGNVAMGPEGLSASLQSPSLSAQDLPALFAGLLGSSAPAGLAIAGDAPLDVTMQVARDTGALTATGRLGAARVQFGTLAITNLAAPFRLAEDVLVVKPLTFSTYGGSERGTLQVWPRRTPTAWTLDTRLEGLDINAFLSANTTAVDRLLGTGQLVGRLRGSTDLPVERHTSGTVGVVLSNGVIRNFALLAAINRALHITGGDAKDTRFERLSATLALAGGTIRTDDALLTAGELTATAAGTISPERTIDMTGRAVFSREASARMIASVKEISGARNPRGEVEVPFTISGSVEAPAFAIDTQQILGRAIRKEIERNIRKGLDRFLRRP